jgi:hypothetical protein
MHKLITTDDVKSLAKLFGLELEVIKTVTIVESSGSGFEPTTGKIKIQFEPQFFKRLKIVNGVEAQGKEWAAYEKAKAINADEAMKATSWGLGQIMGFNHKVAGYATVSAMVSEFQISEYYQLKGMLNFICDNPIMVEALKKKEWAVFASLYNGKGYKKFKYDTRLADAYQKVKKI